MAICDVSTVKNIGRSRCNVLPKAFRTFLKTPEGWSISADATASQWQTALEALGGNRVFLFPDDFDFEPDNEETQYQTSGLGDEAFVRQGQYRFRMLFNQNLEIHKAMYSHLGAGGGMLPIDVKGNLIYWDSGTNGDLIKPFTIGNFTPENMRFGGGSEISVSPIRITWANDQEFNLYGYILDFNAIKLALKSLTTVRLTIVGTPSATEIQVKVASILDGITVLGLVQADFVVSEGSVSGVTDANADGTYVIAGTGFDPGGTVNLVAATALSIRGYESEGAVAYTVPS